MASPATPQPEQGAQPQGAPAPGGQQANPLQSALAQLAKVCEQLAQQNPIVQAELSQARQQFIQALQKTMMAGKQQPQEQAPTPQAGPQ